MWLSILSSIVCFAIATILFTPYFRDFKIYQPISFYFLFQGFSSLLNFIVNEVWPGSTIMLFINSMGILIFGIYITVYFYINYYKNDSNKK